MWIRDAPGLPAAIACEVFLATGHCHRCWLLSAAALCIFCREELGLVRPEAAHAALID